jgi:putative flippase GtrA
MKNIPDPNGQKSLLQRLRGLLSGKGVRQLIRYGVVGVGINAALYAVYLLLVFWGFEPKTSMSVVYVIGLGIGFYGHRKLTFFHTENFKHAITRYLIAHAGGYGINFFLLLAFVDHMGLSHALVQAVSVFIVAAYLFIIFKYWVFSEKNYAAS